MDILPAIADVLGTTLPWDVDGHSPLDASKAERFWKTFIRRNAERVRVERYPPELGDRSFEQMLRHFETEVYGLGPHASFVGRSVANLDVLGGGSSMVSLDDAQMFANVDIDAGTLPLYVRGRILGPSRERVSLGIGVNGVIVATTVSYLERGNWVFASMIPEEALIAGANDVQVLVLGRAGVGRRGDAPAGGEERRARDESPQPIRSAN